MIIHLYKRKINFCKSTKQIVHKKNSFYFTVSFTKANVDFVFLYHFYRFNFQKFAIVVAVYFIFKLVYFP